jgi:hypothetical protein
MNQTLRSLFLDNMTVRAHFDGHQVQLDEPVTLQPDTELLVTILPAASKTDFEAERREWNEFALASFARLYDDEPDIYTSEMIKIRNPKFRGRK